MDEVCEETKGNMGAGRLSEWGVGGGGDGG